MTWLTMVRFILPYAVFSLVGFVAAWQLQGVRVDAAKNELAEYKTEQQRLKNEAEIAAEKRRKETANEYQTKLDALEADHDTYKRCVAAGKCGARVVRLPNLPNGAGVRVSPPGRTDADRPDAVPVAGEVAEGAEVLKDCARTTLQLNQLQDDIEKQSGK
ncbi:MAG: hypothetical protein E6Q97_04755 [Desulfurellales bacterium]|nr:MAG: hypothetical protein E6Q97_04755 [Desulfurellales bacterium]